MRTYRSHTTHQAVPWFNGCIVNVILHRNKQRFIYLLIMSIALMPLQGVWAASTAAFSDAVSAESLRDINHANHGSHEISQQAQTMDSHIAKVTDHCDKQQAKCDQCDNCSHCINLLNNHIVQGAQPLQCFSVSYLIHYHSIEQHPLFRPPIRS
ncbi:hypothetical protein [Kaarinaea lacus]